MLVCRVPFSLNFFLPYIFTLIIFAYGFCVFAKKINFQKLIAEREAFALSSSEGFEWKSESSGRNRMGHTCAVCGNRSYLRCSVCKAVRYCSGICQIKHWKSGHKAECEVIQPARGIHLTQTQVANQGRTAWETSGSKNMVYEDITQQREQEDDLSGETEPREVDGYGIFKSFSGEHAGYFQGLGAGPRPPKSTAHIQAQLDAQQREVEQARKELDEVLAILKEVQSQMQNERQLRKKMQTQFLAHTEHQRAMQEQLQVSISFQIQEAMQTTLSLSRSFPVCMICLTNEKDLAFGCGHMVSFTLSMTYSFFLDVLKLLQSYTYSNTDLQGVRFQIVQLSVMPKANHLPAQAVSTVTAGVIGIYILYSGDKGLFGIEN